MNTKNTTRMGRIGKVLVCALGWIAAVGLTASLEAQQRQTTVVNYTCNIGGAPAQMTAQVEAISPAGIFQGGDGRFAGAIGTGEVNYYYQGSMVSANSGYSFTGENGFADFVDLVNNERFRVQMVIQGQQLMMIINPQGPGPVQYMCQQSNSSAPQAGSVPVSARGPASSQQPPSESVDLDRMMAAMERENSGVSRGSGSFEPLTTAAASFIPDAGYWFLGMIAVMLLALLLLLGSWLIYRVANRS